MFARVPFWFTLPQSLLTAAANTRGDFSLKWLLMITLMVEALTGVCKDHLFSFLSFFQICENSLCFLGCEIKFYRQLAANELKLLYRSLKLNVYMQLFIILFLIWFLPDSSLGASNNTWLVIEILYYIGFYKQNYRLLNGPLWSTLSGLLHHHEL